MQPSMTDSHLSSYYAVFRQPAPLDLKWPDVHALLEAISEVFEEHNGSLRARRGGQLLALRRARGKDIVDRRELAQIRVFLERSGPLPRRAATGPAKV
jgi:hypothetical protein